MSDSGCGIAISVIMLTDLVEQFLGVVSFFLGDKVLLPRESSRFKIMMLFILLLLYHLLNDRGALN